MASPARSLNAAACSGTARRLAVCFVMAGTSLALVGCGTAPPVNAGYFTPSNAPFAESEKSYTIADRDQEALIKAKEEKARQERLTKANQEKAAASTGSSAPQK